ncbi:PLC-like phosphodiesterase [Laetiporus sulphureus 93-53]|uniref:PLC-like phosphodiesterase n=1 Tax=Laetiporus sulphureus 93-53 TaxID=1314785 RepID=A0A165F0R9_9APHY|nr:PLC-like phosphodiesterase [Laetiporus sulphureus 93-53]KZT08124.1 PLC-like phosphodiesterase [Laetiporus sulphureus 93-53]
MGQGGNLTLINGSPYTWEVSYVHSYQMNSWPFDTSTTVAPGADVPFYVEWDESILVDTGDDAAEATFTLEGTSSYFQVQARWQYVQVVFEGIETENNPEGSTISLGWETNGVMPFILSGNTSSFSSNNPPVAWMQSNIETLGSRPLRQICIPGSHDAGMSVLNSGTAFATTDNTVTQTTTIGGQLTYGSRYFDVRPVISAGEYMAGHYSDIEVIGWQGGNGQSFADIIDEINTFTDDNAELIVLNLSHDLDTDLDPDYEPFTQEQWDALFEQLTGINALFVASNPSTVDLSTLALSDFIGSGEAAVIVIVEPSNGSITLGDYASGGFYLYSQFNVYNEYSDTSDLDDMISDQLQKLADVRQTPDSQLFLLSWTLTQDLADAIDLDQTILQLAATADPLLYTDLIPACTSDTYPNILYVDGFNTSDLAALAMAINLKFAA